MRICLVSFEYPPDSLVMGGAGTYANFLANGLRKKGVEVYTVTSGKETTYAHKTYRIPIPNITYWRRLFFVNSAIHLIRDLNRVYNFHLVHFNEPHVITSNLSLPTVSTFHTTQLLQLKLNITGQSLKSVESIRDLVVKNPVGHLCDIVTSCISDKIICPSPTLVQLLRYCFVDDRKIHVIPNGIDPTMFDELTYDTDILDKYGLEKEKYILYMGRLTPLKGVHYLLRAFKSVKEEHAHLKLVIAGTGDFEPYLKRLALSIKDVLFTGYIDSPTIKKLLYENCAVVVLPSIYETLPMVLLEAMVFNKPVVASNIGGVSSLVAHGRNGFLAKPKDVNGLKLFIDRLVENPNLRRRMGTFGRTLVEKEFTLDKMVDETLKVYESLL